MPPTLEVTLNMRVDARQVNALDLNSVIDALNKDFSQVLANGTGVNQANRMWHDQRTLAASATESLDLAGVLTDAFGNVLTFTRIRALIIRALATNTNNVNVARPAVNGVPLFLAASDGIGLRPGGVLILTAPDAAGVAVTAGTGDLLEVTNSGAGSSVVYDIIVLGTV